MDAAWIKVIVLTLAECVAPEVSVAVIRVIFDSPQFQADEYDIRACRIVYGIPTN